MFNLELLIKLLHTIAWILIYYNLSIYPKNDGRVLVHDYGTDDPICCKIYRFIVNSGWGLLGLIIELVILWFSKLK